jgi:hypothetical protein
VPLGLVEQPPHLGEAPKVGPHRQGLAAGRGDRGDHLLGRYLVADEAEHHGGVVTGQALHDRPANPPRAARDQRRLTRKHPHASLLSHGLPPSELRPATTHPIEARPFR